MAVVGNVKSVKVVLKLSEGTQTITGCNVKASDTQLYTLGTSVGKLCKNNVESITKVVESTLVSE